MSVRNWENRVRMPPLRFPAGPCAGLVLLLIASTACAPSPQPPAKPAAPPAGSVEPAPKAVMEASFWSQWSDGQAELSAYDLVYPRYGKPRPGTAVTIFVTEPMSLTARVKADPGKHPDTDVFPVMKLNLIEDFATGVYDYNEATSSFLALASNAHQPIGTLTKVSFSSQEWCGHSWAQWIRQPKGLDYVGHSYFDGEADRAHTLDQPAGGIAEEQLFFWARGIAEPKLLPGASVTVPFLRSLQYQRHAHREAAWTTATLSRSASAAPGQPGVELWKAEVGGGGPTITFHVEQAVPNRILRWETSDGESARLIKSARMKYWQMNQPGGESALALLGLKPRPARIP